MVAPKLFQINFLPTLTGRHEIENLLDYARDKLLTIAFSIGNMDLRGHGQYQANKTKTDGRMHEETAVGSLTTCSDYPA